MFTYMDSLAVICPILFNGNINWCNNIWIKITIGDPREFILYFLIGLSSKANQTNNVIIRRIWSNTVGHWLDLSIWFIILKPCTFYIVHRLM